MARIGVDMTVANLVIADMEESNHKDPSQILVAVCGCLTHCAPITQGG